MKKLVWKKKYNWFFVPIVFLIAFVIYFWPISGYIESPGQANNLNDFVKIAGKKDNNKGAFRITSVYVRNATLGRYLLSQINSDLDYQTESELTGGDSEENYYKVQNFYMESAIADAELVAYKKANKEANIKYEGIYVLSLAKGNKLSDKIEIGDVITSIDGKSFDNSKGFMEYLASKKPGEKVKITYMRDKKFYDVEAETIKLANTKSAEYPDGRTGIGIILTDKVSVTTNPKATIDAKGIAGPSGGLMFALEIYNQLTNDSINKDRNIAGSGTIDANGNVGEIGGVDKKVIAADKAGATIFFTPYVEVPKWLLKYEEKGMTNYQLAKKTAQQYAPNMKIIPVRTFDDAIDYLKTGKINVKVKD